MLGKARMLPKDVDRSKVSKIDTFPQGKKAGFCLLWKGEQSLDDPRWVLSVVFSLPDYVPGSPAYLQMMTLHVQFAYNDVYANGKLVGTLTPPNAPGADVRNCWWNETIIIENLNKGKNKLEVMSRNETGGQAGNIDMFRLRNPLLIYAAE